MLSMRPIRTAATATALVLQICLIHAPGVGARTCEAPPGTSAIEQYCESLPRAGGNGPGRSGVGRAVDRRTADELLRTGREGAGVLSLPPGAPGDGPPQARSGGAATDAPSDNPVGAVGASVDSDSGASVLWVLGAVALAMVALALLRLRRGMQD